MSLWPLFSRRPMCPNPLRIGMRLRCIGSNDQNLFWLISKATSVKLYSGLKQYNSTSTRQMRHLKHRLAFKNENGVLLPSPSFHDANMFGFSSVSADNRPSALWKGGVHYMSAMIEQSQNDVVSKKPILPGARKRIFVTAWTFKKIRFDSRRGLNQTKRFNKPNWC